MTIPFHPFANIFPLIEGDQFEGLVESIKSNGQRRPVVLFDDMILDGRNRYNACVKAGVEPVFETFSGSDPLAFVIDENLTRRHLNESQRSMAAARAANMRQGERTDLQRAEPEGLPTHEFVPLPANLPKVDQAEAAHRFAISERLLRSAKVVQEHGTPDLIAAVDRGEVAVSLAEKVAKLTPDKQANIVTRAAERGGNAMKTALKKIFRDTREADLGARQRAMPNVKAGIILEDFEWHHETWSEAGMDRHAANHYETASDAVTPEQIVERTAKRFEVAAEDCVLFMWSTVQHLWIAMQVMNLRGFTYKSHFAWDKGRISLGRWNRNKHELLLIGTRGKIIAPAEGTQFDSLLAELSRGHSMKPDWQYRLIESYYPTQPKIEINARTRREGWESWGNQLPEDEVA